jgi:hypothetical protein
VLKEHGISPTREGLAGYLRGLEPTPEQLAAARRLIAQLGDADSFIVRETAMKQLIALPQPPMDVLATATASSDPEVRWRAAKVLSAIRGGQRDRVLFAVLKTIEQEKTPGVASELLQAIPHCGDQYLQQAAAGALVASAQAADADLLRQSLRHANIERRAAACLALEQAIGAKAGEDLRPLLANSPAEVRLAAAHALANHGDRTALAVLVELLEAESIDVRSRASALLRAATGQQVAFAAYAAADERAEKVKQWRTWLDEHGKTARLQFPLKSLAQAEIGHTIVVAYSQGRVYVIDQQGKEILKLQCEFSGPWGAQFLPNGHYLVNYYGSAAIVEYNAQGKEVWRFQPGNLNSTWCAQRLASGNTLLTHGQTVLEVDAKGAKVWEKAFEANLCQAIRLENGNLLLATTAAPGRVFEVDRSGKEVFEIEGTLTAYRLQRLENGNTLVTEKGASRVREFNPRGEVVWEHAIPGPDGAQRIANGNTLIGNSEGLHEVTPKGEVVWRHEVSGQTLFWRY